MSEFIPKAVEIAKKVMDGVDPLLSDKFTMLIRFLSDNPATASVLKGKNNPLLSLSENKEYNS